MKTTDKYILNDKGEPVPCNDLLKWARWFEKADRVVKQETVNRRWISTVFLGLDHRFCGIGPPVLWETIVFARKTSMRYKASTIEMARCSGSREQAEAMHDRIVKNWKRK